MPSNSYKRKYKISLHKADRLNLYSDSIQIHWLRYVENAPIQRTKGASVY